MPQIHPLSSDAGNSFEDLSGVNSEAFSNPYDALIDACHNDPVSARSLDIDSAPAGILSTQWKQIQSRYSTHRTARNAKQKENLLAPDFKGLNLDSILQRLEDPSIEHGFVDPRHSLVFWARPPPHVQDIVSQIQQRLQKLAPNIWLMPIQNLHMTALEVTHSVTAPEISALVTRLRPLIPAMADLPYTHRPRLIKPFVSYDSSALALSFLPAAGENLSPAHPSRPRRQAGDDHYTYHHLRRELFAMANSAGVTIESRYVVPSAHITIGRFLVQRDHDSREKMERWVREIEAVNEWLEAEFWPRPTGGKPDGVAEEQAEQTKQEEFEVAGEWVVGEGKGLDLRKGLLWYGGGETVRLGKGFEGIL